MSIRLSGIKGVGDTGAAIVGDTVGSCVGALLEDDPGLKFNVTRQPSGSDVFAGLGTGGADLPIADLSSASFAVPGCFEFAASDVAGASLAFVILVWPSAALNVAQIKFTSSNQAYQRQHAERRGVLKALALAANLAAATTLLEGMLSAPYFGTSPRSLGANTADNYGPFGGW